MNDLFDQNLYIHLLRRRMAALDEGVATLTDRREPADDEDWERVIFAGAELVSAYRSLVRSRGGSARQRILHYLQNHVGEVVDGDILAAIAGISEWARRVRELDVEMGYPIATNATDPTMKPGEYRLESAEPDPAGAEWWRLKRALRRDEDLYPGDKVVRMLRERDAVSPPELHYVVEPNDYRVIIEELRIAGWDIVIETSGERADDSIRFRLRGDASGG